MWMCMYVYVCTYICIYLCVYSIMYICMYMFVNMCVCMYMCIHVNVCMYIYVCVHVYTTTYTNHRVKLSHEEEWSCHYRKSGWNGRAWHWAKKSETARFLSYSEFRIYIGIITTWSPTCVISSLFLPLTFVFYLFHYVSVKRNIWPFQMLCSAKARARLWRYSNRGTSIEMRCLLGSNTVCELRDPLASSSQLCCGCCI